MLKIGIAGVRGLSTVAGFQAAGDVQVAALCDLDADLLSERQTALGIPRGYRVFEDMLSSDIDAVVVATPMQCHVPQAILALQAGKHVLSEVTAGVTMDELWWLIEEVERSGRVYMMAENYCYIPDVQLIGSLVREGALGEVYYGEGEYLHNLRSILNYDYGPHHSGKPTWRSIDLTSCHGQPVRSVGDGPVRAEGIRFRSGFIGYA
jgi:predicted dehydrogenase